MDTGGWCRKARGLEDESDWDEEGIRIRSPGGKERGGRFPVVGVGRREGGEGAGRDFPVFRLQSSNGQHLDSADPSQLIANSVIFI